MAKKEQISVGFSGRYPFSELGAYIKCAGKKDKMFGPPVPFIGLVPMIDDGVPCWLNDPNGKEKISREDAQILRAASSVVDIPTCTQCGEACAN